MDFLNSLSASAFGKVLTSGAVVNFFLVLLGTLLGLLLKKVFPKEYRKH